MLLSNCAFNNGEFLYVCIDANKDGSFEAASDIVIHLSNFTQGLTNLDFQFH